MKSNTKFPAYKEITRARDRSGEKFLPGPLTLSLANWHYFGIIAPPIEDAVEECLFMTVVSADRYPFDPSAVSSDRRLNNDNTRFIAACTVI